MKNGARPERGEEEARCEQEEGEGATVEPTPEGGSLSEQGEGRLNAVEKWRPTMTILNLKVNPEVWWQGEDVEETHQLTQDFKKRNCRSTPEKESTCPVQ